MKPPIRLALVWHFHQPEYTDPATGAPTMPWTRLHAIKDYADMAEHLARHPRVHATINVVPSLLDQLLVLGEGRGRSDPFLELARRDAAALTPDERRFVVTHFFSFNRETLAHGLRRVHELAALRGEYGRESMPQAAVDRFDEEALRDLQVLFHLAWCGPLLTADPRVVALREKGRRFTESDKQDLLDLQARFLAGIVPRFRTLAESGQVEFSASAYFHPILPLLAGLEAAHEALPALRLPAVSFQHAEDARLQLRAGLDRFAEVFGRKAQGGWPPEGAISEASLALMAEAGYSWAASDEDVLFGSLGGRSPAEGATAEVRRRTLLYRPWRHGSGPVLLFRDHELSDRIGFVYSAWRPTVAAEDLLRRLLQIRDALPEADGPYTVSIILDGENAWEYYSDNAAEFFIGRNLATWIGHPEKNRAWEALAETRRFVAGRRGAPKLEDPAWRAVLAAEGSDWFWWFGDDHFTPFALEFDAGFRRHLRAAWTALGVEPPETLERTIREHAPRGFQLPVGPVRPTLDGRISDYFEWLAAGRAEAGSGAMHASTRLVREVLYGCDGPRLYVRLDPVESPARTSLGGSILILRLPGLPDHTLRVPIPAEGAATTSGVEVAVGRIVEAGIPLEALAAGESGLHFQVEVETVSGASQRVPADGSLFLPGAAEDPSRFDWSV
jgi:alpha-amylase/alpha-mannosidase (GH57 family)